VVEEVVEQEEEQVRKDVEEEDTLEKGVIVGTSYFDDASWLLWPNSKVLSAIDK